MYPINFLNELNSLIKTSKQKFLKSKESLEKVTFNHINFKDTTKSTLAKNQSTHDELEKNHLSPKFRQYIKNCTSKKTKRKRIKMKFCFHRWMIKSNHFYSIKSYSI